MDLKRRDFLKILGATTVATALPGCTQKQPKQLIPYVVPAEEIIPGRSVWYATVCRECPAGCGVSIRVREGRATKAEGNPFHPINKGSLCARGQAGLQGLYNPDRIQHPMRKTAAGGWEQMEWGKAEEYLVAQLAAIMQQGRGKDIVWITPHMTGSLDALVDNWLAAMGSKRRYRYEAFGHEALRKANEITFGLAEIPVYDFHNADVVLSFGTDFLETWLSPVEHARQFASMRGYEQKRRSHFVYVGPRLSMTASNADEWVNVHPDNFAQLALSMVNVILKEGLARRISGVEARRIESIVKSYEPRAVSESVGVSAEKIVDIAERMARAQLSVAVAGGPMVEGQYGTQAIAAVNLLNHVCGSIGTAIRFGPTSSLSNVSTYESFEKLVGQIERSEVAALFFTDVNPAFSAQIGSRFAAAVGEVPLVVGCSSFMDETTSLATLVMPVHTPWESWGDFEPHAGIHGLMQPVMQPVFETKMLGDILLDTGRRLNAGFRFDAATFHEFVKNRWRELHLRLDRGTDFETFWVESLARGGVWESAAARPLGLSSGLNGSFFARQKQPTQREGTAFTLITYPSVCHFDGRGANKPWLQELPDPMTRLTWDNWVEVSPEDARRLEIRNGDVMQVRSSHGTVELPAYVFKGIHPGYVAIPIGQGHTDYGRYARGVGVNVTPILDPKPSPDGSGGIVWFGTKVELMKMPQTSILATVQKADSQENRSIVQVVSLKELDASEMTEEPQAPSLYPEQTYSRHRWGMVIDLDKCTGCSACVTACYAENNIPVVGKEDVINGRVMAWIRIDRYFDDNAAVDGVAPSAERIPMLCQQCGSAPCETVCPVYAAYHTEEGLNGQVYNRCIGTRYCANNCPYKVRRFNWWDHDWPEPLNWQLNPDVTVRSKGVMEKCTFCVQRIVEAKHNARMENRKVRDGEITTACQQACPSLAMTFGDLKDVESKVFGLSSKNQPRGYHVLEELNTLPAVTYLKKVRT